MLKKKYFPPVSHCVFLRVKWSTLKPPEPASWPTQRHSTPEIKTNFMIVVRIIKSLAGSPSKMKAHLFSEVYNLVVNVSFGPKHPRLCVCLEHITALLEKNGLRVVPPSLSTQGTEGFKLALLLFHVWRQWSARQNQRWGGRRRWAWTCCTNSHILVHLCNRQPPPWLLLTPVSVPLGAEKSRRALDPCSLWSLAFLPGLGVFIVFIFSKIILKNPPRND